MKEIWKDIPGYKGKYQASNYGRIKSLSRKVRFTGRWKKELFRTIEEKILKHHNKINGAGYYGVSLGHNRSEMVHRLVCLTFHGNPPPGKHQVNHIDFNKLNNNASNLCWMAPKENVRHAIDGHRFDEHYKNVSKRWSGVGNVKAKLTEKDVLFIKQNKHIPTKELSKKYCISITNINQIKNGLIWRHLNH